ncbi:PLP-dependent aminotransferase family protein [Sphingomonas sp. 22176]|uniref:aminotransferase-like domain-containing protein n=1 Tax=Sphingomonas sp. 22176 TaxID=3453884 RepID=UPI003F85DE6A
MQGWKPDIAGTLGPKYLAIAEAIARDIEGGALRPGDRLPPQRMLAELLGVDLTTITRAYGEAQRLGLIEGDGRRGSFVRNQAAQPPGIAYAEPADAGMNAPPEAGDRQLEKAFAASAASLLGRADGPAPFHYQPRGGMGLARTAGAALLQERGIPAQEDSVLISAGGQHALHAVTSTELRPGDVLAVAAFVYPGLLAVARRYGLKLRVVASDGEGMLPEALAQACAEGAAAAYVVPTNDNPTTATLGVARRAALAAVVRSHGIKLIEDDAYGLLPERPLPPLAALVPERCWHIASVSKILSPGLRVAWIAAPDIAAAWRLAADLHETAVMAPPLNVAVVADWLHGGSFDTLRAAVREEARARQAIARAVLRPGSFHAQDEGYHLWMPLPAGANPAEIVSALRPQGLAVVAGDAFAVAPSAAPPALRISIGGSMPRDRLERALRLLDALTTPGATRKIALV